MKTNIDVFLDSKVEINVMTQNLKKKEYLTMRFYSVINLMFHTGDKKIFLDVCKNVEFRIDEIRCKIHIFVVDQTNHQLILRQFFFSQMKMNLNYKSGDDLICIVRFENDVKTIEFNVLSFDFSNDKIVENIFPETARLN